MKQSYLYIVATPLGNLEDITLRAIRVLKEVDVIFCEDTRTTRVLLVAHSIEKPTESFHAHSSEAKVDRIIEVLQEGKSIALVTDAGTPGISDPGTYLVARVKEALGDTVGIVPVPGPTAFVAALSASGVPVDEFTFLGFLPHKKGRKTLFDEICTSSRTCVFYESPHRLMKSLTSLLGAHKKVTVAKELTKIYEEFVSGTPEYVFDYFEKRSDKVRGEFVVIVSAP